MSKFKLTRGVKGKGTAPVVLVLNDLTFSASQVWNDVPAGTIVASINGKSSLSALSFVPPTDLFEFDGANIRRTATGILTPGGPTAYTVREAKAATSNSPNDNTWNLTVINATAVDAFTFGDVPQASISAEYTSNTITVSGPLSSVPISISGAGEYQINGGDWVSASGAVRAGDLVRVRHTSSSDYETATNTTLTIGSQSDVFTTTTAAAPVPDLVPDQFTFTDVSGATVDTEYESNTITIAGITGTIAISVTGGEYSKNGGGYTSAPGTAVNTDTIKVRHTSAATALTQTSTVFTAGGVSDSFSTTTEQAEVVGLQYMTPGSTAYRSWALLADDDPLLDAQGSPGDYGYDERPIGVWGPPALYHTVGEGQEIIFSVAAAKPPEFEDFQDGDYLGIKEVWFSCSNGPWVVVTERAPHPVYGNEDYLCGLREADCSTSRTHEVRAIVVPHVGKPYCLQGRDCSGPPNATVANGLLGDRFAGQPSPSNPTGASIDSRTLPQWNAGAMVRMPPYQEHGWSQIVTINKGDQPAPVFYIDTVNATGLASDSNNGLTRGAPFLTWEKIRDATLTAIGGTDELGGATWYVTGAANNHYHPSFSVSNANKVFACANANLVVARDPALPKGAVVFSQRKTQQLYVEKFHRKGISSYVVNWQVAANGNDPTASHNSTIFEDCDHDGGPGVVPLDSTGYPNYHLRGSPNGDPICWPGNSCNGHYAIINAELHHSIFSGVHNKTTIAHNVYVHHIAAGGDIHDDPKYSHKVRMTDIEGRQLEVDPSTGLGGPHCDGLQFYRKYYQSFVRDFNMDDASVTIQGFLVDGLATIQDIAFINTRFKGMGSPGLSLRYPPRNFLWRNVSQVPGGVTQMWAENVALPNARNFRIVLDEYGSTAGGVANQFGWESSFRPGKSVLYTSASGVLTTKEPMDGPLPSDWDAGGALAVWDAEVSRGVITVTSGSNDANFGDAERVWKLFNLKAPGEFFAMEDNTAATVQFDARRPLYLPTGFNGRPGLAFNGVNSASTASGSSNLASGTNSGSTPNAIAGSAAKEIWCIFDFQDESTVASDRWLWSFGRGNVGLRRSYATGAARLKLMGQGYSGSTAGAIVTCQDTTYAMALGPKVVRAQLFSDGLQLTVWDAANPSGRVFTKASFASGYVLTVPDHDSMLNGWPQSTTGYQNTFVEYVFNALIAFPPLSGDALATVTALAKARAGIS